MKRNDNGKMLAEAPVGRLLFKLAVPTVTAQIMISVLLTVLLLVLNCGRSFAARNARPRMRGAFILLSAA